MTTEYLLVQYLLIGMMFAANEFRMDYALMEQAFDELVGPSVDILPPNFKKVVMFGLFISLTLFWPVALLCRLAGLLLRAIR